MKFRINSTDNHHTKATNRTTTTTTTTTKVSISISITITSTKTAVNNSLNSHNTADYCFQCELTCISANRGKPCQGHEDDNDGEEG